MGNEMPDEMKFENDTIINNSDDTSPVDLDALITSASNEYLSDSENSTDCDTEKSSIVPHANYDYIDEINDIDILKKELRHAKEENDRLQKTFMEFFDRFADEKAEMSRRNKGLEAQNSYENVSFKSRVGEMLCASLGQWHFPFTLPFKLANLWIRENRCKAPAILGGDSFRRVISAYEEGGFGQVKRLLARANTTPFIRGNAWTALARNLKMKKRRREMAMAARLAYEEEPKLFRLKWYAFRLHEAGRVEEADAFLQYLRDKIPFSDTEEGVRREIEATASSEAAILTRLAFTRALEGAITGEEGFDPENPFYSQNMEVINSYLIEACRSKGPEMCARLVSRILRRNKRFTALKLIQISREVRDDFPEYEYRLVDYAMRMDPTPANIKTFFWAAQRARKFLNAYRAIGKFERAIGDEPAELDAATLERMKTSITFQLELLDRVQHRYEADREDCVKNRICYILHNSLPYSSGGYATRAHGVAVGLARRGYDVIALTRPGYPLDIVADMAEEDIPREMVDIDGVKYARILTPLRRDKSAREYMGEAADALEIELARLKPEVVIAASNHVTGLPALIACRRLGIPFIYEVRGLWEITRVSRENEFGNSPAFHVQKIFEAQVCNKADHALTLTEGLKDELVRRGVKTQGVTLAPNACDPERFQPLPRDAVLAEKYGIPENVPVIGYIGTFVVYEGLEDLAAACAILKNKGIEFRLMLVGNENASGNDRGPIWEEIVRIAEDNGFAQWLVMPGRVPHEEVGAYYSLVDIAPFPRKPWPVCEIVSPMKPLEAMAMEKAVLVSSARALAEMVDDEVTGRIFYKGSIEDLAVKLEELINLPAQREKLGKNARKFVERERTWEYVTGVIGDVIENVINSFREGKIRHREAIEESSNRENIPGRT